MHQSYVVPVYLALTVDRNLTLLWAYRKFEHTISQPHAAHTYHPWWNRQARYLVASAVCSSSWRSHKSSSSTLVPARRCVFMYLALTTNSNLTIFWAYRIFQDTIASHTHIAQCGISRRDTWWHLPCARRAGGCTNQTPRL